MLQKLFATLAILGFLGGLAGCNTIAGMGTDIERGGDAVHDAARDTQKRM